MSDSKPAKATTSTALEVSPLEAYNKALKELKPGNEHVARQIVIASFNKAEKQVFEEEQAKDAKAMKGLVARYYEFGQRCQAVKDGEGTKYGEKVIERLAFAWGKDVSLCYRSMRVVAWKPLKELLATGLSWTWIVECEAIADQKERERIFAKGDKESWPLQQLRAEKKAISARTAPRAQTPRGVKGNLTSVSALASDLRRILSGRFDDQVLTPFEGDVDDSMCTPETVELLHSSREELESLAEEARTRALRLGEIEKAVRERLPDDPSGDATESAAPSPGSGRKRVLAAGRSASPEPSKAAPPDSARSPGGQATKRRQIPAT